MRCTWCVITGKCSSVFVGASAASAQAGLSYWDTDDVFHHHDPTALTTEYACSNGHRWRVETRYGCKGCGKGASKTTVRLNDAALPTTATRLGTAMRHIISELQPSAPDPDPAQSWVTPTTEAGSDLYSASPSTTAHSTTTPQNAVTRPTPSRSSAWSSATPQPQPQPPLQPQLQSQSQTTITTTSTTTTSSCGTQTQNQSQSQSQILPPAQLVAPTVLLQGQNWQTLQYLERESAPGYVNRNTYQRQRL